MASLYKKVISGKPYWYLREMAWVDGKPKMVSERYLGSVADITALLDAREAAVLPERTRHLAFGDVAAVWGVMVGLGVVATIDEVVGARRADAGASVGTFLALAALGRLVDPCSKRAFADWWKSTAADRFTKISAGALDHRKFWEAMRTITTEGTGAGGAPPRPAHDRAVRSGHQFPGPRYDELRHVHRLHQRQGADRPARQGEAETRRSTAGRVGPGRHPRRRDPPGQPRLCRQPARRHPVHHNDRSAGSPARRVDRPRRAIPADADDRGVRRRAELATQLRPPTPRQAVIRRVGAALRLPRPAGPT